MECLWCKVIKQPDDYSGKQKHCKKCHLIKYKDNVRKTTEIQCPNCLLFRNMRNDAYKKRYTDLCNKCAPLINKQLFKSTHGLDINHPLYTRWWNMKSRVKDIHKRKYYKDKNIIVCDEWLDYKNFYNWALSNGFNANLEIDRIDENGNYCPENCQWITHKENTLKIKNLFGRIKLN